MSVPSVRVTVAACVPMCMFLQALTYAIERSCINKAEVVSEDEREGGVRATLNLGHTFGHAMESSQGYGKIHVRAEPCRDIEHP